MSQSYTNLLYHLIFSTKERQPIINAEHQLRLYDYIGGIIRGTGGIPLIASFAGTSTLLTRVPIDT